MAGARFWGGLLLAGSILAAQGIEGSLVMVRAKLGEGSLVRHGSGVVVGPGLVATNAHVVYGGHQLVIRKGTSTWPVAQVRMDSARDLCLLTVPGLPCASVVFSPDQARAGMEVQAAGFPGGYAFTKTQGRLIGVWHYGEALLLQGDAATYPGSSGGGLFDQEGRLLGLTTFTFSDNPRLNFSVPTRWIQELMDERSLAQGVERPVSETLVSTDFLSQLIEDERNWPTWGQAARDWTRSNPDDPDAWMALGLALDRMARLEASRGFGIPEATLNEAADAFERSVGIRRVSLRPQAMGWNALGVTLDALNQFDRAERAFRQALRLDATYGRAWLNLGASLLNGGRFKESAESLHKGLAIEPDNGTAWARYTFALRESGSAKQAADIYVVALRYRPLSDELWMELGSLQWKLDQRAEAEAILAKLHELNSPYESTLKALLRQKKAY